MAHQGPTTPDPAETLRRIDAAIVGDFDEVLSSQFDSIDEVLGTIDEELGLGQEPRSEAIEPTIVDLTPRPPAITAPAATASSTAKPSTAVPTPVRTREPQPPLVVETIDSTPAISVSRLKAVLAPINAPLQMLPPPWRAFANLVILTLLAWVPVVWAVVWLLS